MATTLLDIPGEVLCKIIEKASDDCPKSKFRIMNCISNSFRAAVNLNDQSLARQWRLFKKWHTRFVFVNVYADIVDMIHNSNTLIIEHAHVLTVAVNISHWLFKDMDIACRGGDSNFDVSEKLRKQIMLSIAHPTSQILHTWAIGVGAILDGCNFCCIRPSSTFVVDPNHKVTGARWDAESLNDIAHFYLMEGTGLGWACGKFNDNPWLHFLRQDFPLNGVSPTKAKDQMKKRFQNAIIGRSKINRFRRALSCCSSIEEIYNSETNMKKSRSRRMSAPGSWREAELQHASAIKRHDQRPI